MTIRTIKNQSHQKIEAKKINKFCYKMKIPSKLIDHKIYDFNLFTRQKWTLHKVSPPIDYEFLTFWKISVSC